MFDSVPELLKLRAEIHRLIEFDSLPLASVLDIKIASNSSKSMNNLRLLINQVIRNINLLILQVFLEQVLDLALRVDVALRLKSRSHLFVPMLRLFHTYYLFFGLVQLSIVFCFDRDRVNLSAGVSRVMVEPAPMVALRDILTGATSCVSDPINTPSSILVMLLSAPRLT